MENLADIVGAGATVPLSSTNITARTIQMAVTGAGIVRYGGSTTSATSGIPIVAGGTGLLPYLGESGGEGSPYSLRGIYAYIPVGATLSVIYEPYN